MTQRLGFEDDLGFAPASPVDDALERLFPLTASRGPGARGPKQSLEAPAGSLSLNVTWQRPAQPDPSPAWVD